MGVLKLFVLKQMVLGYLAFWVERPFEEIFQSSREREKAKEDMRDEITNIKQSKSRRSGTENYPATSLDPTSRKIIMNLSLVLTWAA